MRACPLVLRRGNSPAAVRNALPLALMWLAALFVACVSLAARADEDLPGRVGRIADFGGQLYQSPEDRPTEWVSIGLNYPVTSGDNLWVSGDGRAEVDYGGGQFRLAGDTNLHISRLDEARLALFIAQGRVIVRVRVLDTGEVARIDAPNTQVQLTRPGLYRVDVTPDRQTTIVTVREGEAIIALAAGAQQALPGQTVSVTGPDPVAADIRNGIGQDGFDTWSSNRDRRYEKSRATAYVSRQMVGYADLDEYGTWQTTPEYGPVWYPAAVAEGWAPYRDGYWTTVGGWGHTWVDYAPWGYAPFHYGRWAWIGGRWGWCPGGYVARPVWAPALVGWYGGAGWGISGSFGAPVYGWVPLGWGDAYHPWWRRCSYNCWAHYNRPYAVNVAVRPNAPPPRYTNIGVPGAITAVAGATLVGRMPVPTNMVRVSPHQVSTAPVLAALPVVATGPLHVPVVRPGTGGTPPPASTFYPVSRFERTGVGAIARPPTAAGTTTRTAAPLPPRPSPSAGAVPPTASGRPTATVGSAAPAGAAVVARPAPSSGAVPTGATTLVPAPAAGGMNTAAPPAPVEARSRPRPQPTPLPQTSGIPMPRTTSQQVSGGAPPPSAPLARSAPARAVQGERGAPVPLQAPQVVPGPAPGAAGPAPQAGGHLAPAPAANPASGRKDAKAAPDKNSAAGTAGK